MEKIENLAAGDEIVIVKSRWESDIGRRLIIGRIHEDGLIEPKGCPGWRLSADSIVRTSYTERSTDACHACGVAKEDIIVVREFRDLLTKRRCVTNIVEQR